MQLRPGNLLAIDEYNLSLSKVEFFALALRVTSLVVGSRHVKPLLATRSHRALNVDREHNLLERRRRPCTSATSCSNSLGEV